MIRCRIPRPGRIQGPRLTARVNASSGRGPWRLQSLARTRQVHSLPVASPRRARKNWGIIATLKRKDGYVA